MPFLPDVCIRDAICCYIPYSTAQSDFPFVIRPACIWSLEPPGLAVLCRFGIHMHFYDFRAKHDNIIEKSHRASDVFFR